MIKLLLIIVNPHCLSAQANYVSHFHSQFWAIICILANTLTNLHGIHFLDQKLKSLIWESICFLAKETLRNIRLHSSQKHNKRQNLKRKKGFDFSSQRSHHGLMGKAFLHLLACAKLFTLNNPRHTNELKRLLRFDLLRLLVLAPFYMPQAPEAPNSPNCHLTPPNLMSFS